MRQSRTFPLVVALLTVLGLLTTSALARAAELKLYGPGGSRWVMEECAQAYEQQSGVKVNVITGPMPTWMMQAKQEADLIMGGSEAQLTLFNQNNPGLVDLSSRVSLYPRAAAILVRPGNPKGIKGVADLARPGVRVLDVTAMGQYGLWEDLAGTKGLIAEVQKNIVANLPNHIVAMEKWRQTPELDAWVTFETWHHPLKDAADLVRLPVDERLLRGTPIALAAHGQRREEAAKFVQFLQTPQAHAIFQKWGWQ